jgi:hypothetical protein
VRVGGLTHPAHPNERLSPRGHEWPLRHTPAPRLDRQEEQEEEEGVAEEGHCTTRLVGWLVGRLVGELVCWEQGPPEDGAARIDRRRRRRPGIQGGHLFY